MTGREIRDNDEVAGSLFSYVDFERRIRSDHPLRVLRGIVNETLVTLSPEFDTLHSLWGRVSIPPERLLRALSLQTFYLICNDHALWRQGIRYEGLRRRITRD